MLDQLLIKLAKEKDQRPTSQDEMLLTDKVKIHKIAFDLFKVDNDPYEHLWRMEDRAGQKFLIRASDPQYDSKEKGDWVALSDYDQKNVTLVYKNIPIQRFSSTEFNFSPDEIITFKGALLDRVNTDQGFVKEVLASKPKTMREAIFNTFPELKKFEG